jgi:hypothetical protein
MASAKIAFAEVSQLVIGGEASSQEAMCVGGCKAA